VDLRRDEILEVKIGSRFTVSSIKFGRFHFEISMGSLSLSLSRGTSFAASGDSGHAPSQAPVIPRYPQDFRRSRKVEKSRHQRPQRGSGRAVDASRIVRWTDLFDW